MVFIVKIPNRSRANTPEASNTPSNEAPPVDPHQGVVTPSLPSTSKDDFLHAGDASQHGTATNESQSQPSNPPGLAPRAAELDVLLAPPVLNHRYVRGVDKSLIVERPERIRAVLLGIATAIGKSSSDQHPTVPAIPTASHSTSSSSAGHANQAAQSTQPPVPSISTTSLDDDDLVARLSSLSVQSSAAIQASAPASMPQRQQQQKIRVLHSTRSLPLDPPHPAVAFTHAHSDELVDILESAYDQAKSKTREARASAFDSQSTTSLSSSSQHQQSTSTFEAQREATPTPASIATPKQEEPTSSTATKTSHAAYLEYLCNRAPNHPPLSQAKLHHTSPSKSIPEDSEAYTSSDGEGDDAMHLSEVPEHLPQGDLYLAGPSDDQDMEGGSAEAIRHAMGACCEAVDRVVSAASTASGSQTTSYLPLQEIKYDASPATSHSDSAHSTDAALPARRAFVLCRPPGHHCSGSTPQGFCWVNNAIVASAHAYLEHAIDRVVIFDIDLHHGNGTQNLAWRINSDANKHDEERAERITGLRASALAKARQALGSGSGRAHANRLAKVALTEEDEAAIKQKAGPRALRLFYSSLHDIESFPCEDGDANMIKDASTCVEGAHGQWIWNVHLDHYRSESDFKRLYNEKYKVLFSKAFRFLTSTGALPQNTLVLISAGFDACSYEYPGMQRHGKHVPPSFYHTFGRDAVRFAEQHAQGKLISVLEGGYSDRALCSAALAHVTGLAVGDHQASSDDDERVEGKRDEEQEAAEFWKLENLIAVEKVAKKMAAHAATAAAATIASANANAGGMASLNTTPKRRQAELVPWLSRTSQAFAAFERACGKEHVQPLGPSSPSNRGGAGRTSAATSTLSSPSTNIAGGGGRVLRDRSARSRQTPAVGSTSAMSTPQQSTTSTRRGATSPTKATPTRTAKRDSSPSKKKDSPTKKGASTAGSGGSGAPFGETVTPVKSQTLPQGEKEETTSMDVDTPTKSKDSPIASASGTVESAKQPSTSAEIKTATNTASTPLPSSSPIKSEALPNVSIPLPTTEFSSASRFINTSSTPQSPALTAEAVILVDAMSSSRQIIDANTKDIVALPSKSDPLGLNYLRTQAFSFANGSNDGDQDAPGSPDPEVDKLHLNNNDGDGGGMRTNGGQSGEYFPVQPDGRRRISLSALASAAAAGGAGGGILGLDLGQATLVKSEHVQPSSPSLSSSSASASMNWPSPREFHHQFQYHQQQHHFDHQ